MGDELQMTTQDGLAKLDIRKGRLLCYTLCDACRTWSNWRAIIRENRWVAIKLADSHELSGGEKAALTRAE